MMFLLTKLKLCLPLNYNNINFRPSLASRLSSIPSWAFLADPYSHKLTLSNEGCYGVQCYPPFERKSSIMLSTIPSTNSFLLLALAEMVLWYYRQLNITPIPIILRTYKLGRIIRISDATDFINVSLSLFWSA